jgi:hypothetical protein
MADTDFTRFVPGFDFLQGLVKNAGAAIPGFNQWVAPTLNPQELDKRIDELRTVQFWLEQNARMLAATIQALEVQRMTLSTLHAMNVPMADLKEVLKTAMPKGDAAAAGTTPWHAVKPAAAAPATAATSGQDKEDPLPHPLPQAGEGATPGDADDTSETDEKDEGKPVGADPMQWWNALTQQFTQVATNAMKTAQTAAAATSAATAAATSAATAAAKSATTAASSATGAAGKPARGATSRPAAKAGTAKAPAKAAAKTASARKPAAKRKTSS